MAQGTYRGTYETADPRAAAQARSMGATIGTDGWWYKDGRKLSHNEADALANSTGKAVDNAHQQWGTGGFVDRNRNFVGNALKNVAPIAGILTGGTAGVALGGLGAALGAGVRKGTNIGNIAKTGVENAMLTSSGQNLAAQFGYNGPMSQVGQAAKAAQAAKVAQTAKTTAAPAASVAEGAAQAASQAAPIPIPPPVTIPPQGTPSVPNILTKPIKVLGGKSVKDIWGFATADKNKDMVKAGIDLFSGATKQEGQMGDQLYDYRKGQIAAQQQDYDANEVEKRRKKQYGEMLAQLFASGFFGNPSGTSTPR